LDRFSAIILHTISTYGDRPPEKRLVGAQLHRYIGDQLYWVLHAPLTSAQAVPIGKTTFLQSWAREINAGNEAVACYVSIEDCQGVIDVDAAMLTMYQAIQNFADFSRIPVPQ
jgi:hypothetical protein